MSHRLRLAAACWIVVALLVGLTVPAAAQTSDTALLRFVHAIPGAAAIDVYTNGQLTVTGLAFGSASTSAVVPAGDHQLTVTASGTSNALWTQTITASPASAYTLVAASASDAQFAVYTTDLSPIDVGKARLTAVHAIAGGPTVDLVLSDGRPVIVGLDYGVQAGTLDVPAFSYDFAVVPTGGAPDQAVLSADGVALSTGTAYMLIVYGTPDAPRVLPVSSAVGATGEAGFVRVVHGVSGAPAVDIYINGALAIPALAFAGYTEHIALAPGSYDVAVRAAGSSTDLLTATLPVESGAAATVAALGSPEEISLNVFADDITGMSADFARLSFVNGIPGTALLSASLADGTLLASGLGFTGSVNAINLAPTQQAISISLADAAVAESSELPVADFYGGVYYNVIAVSDGTMLRLITAPTSLAQGIASAPNAAGAGLVVEPPPAAPTLPAPVVAAAPTPAPVVAAAPTVAPAAPTGPTARVFNLDANANLQLRQYPSSDALSLGTVAPGTILLVNGRAGAIETIPFSATPAPPADYQFVDPASLLADNRQDLTPADTWLNVTYQTPDGGSITAWANALFLEVRNPRGERQRLATLPTVAANLPGSVENTAATPPPIPENRVAATVFNLNPGVNLNIRRIPDANGEVLFRVTNGTVMEFLGIKEDRLWVFVRYSPVEGGSVTGWVSVQYMQFSFNSRLLSLEQIEERGLLVITPDTERGELSAGAVQAALPTVNPTKDAYIAEVILNPGANLNLRRRPDAISEVLAQIPGGTQVIVRARSADERWLLVTYEATEGWIAASTDTASFVRITFNGRPANVVDIPVAVDDAGTVIGSTPTPETTFLNLPVRVTDAVVNLTASPGGSGEGLPVVTAGTLAKLLFTDGSFSYIELEENGVRGWVPAGAVQPR